MLNFTIFRKYNCTAFLGLVKVEYNLIINGNRVVNSTKN